MMYNSEEEAGCRRFDLIELTEDMIEEDKQNKSHGLNILEGIY